MTASEAPEVEDDVARGGGASDRRTKASVRARAATIAHRGDLLFLNPTGVVMYAAPAIGDILGVEPVDLRGMAFSDLIEPGNRPIAAAWFDEVLAADEQSGSAERSADLVLRTVSSAVLAQLRGRAIRRDDHLVGVRVALRSAAVPDTFDVDELILRLMVRTEELRRSNEELVELASVAAHDLRAPLTAVMSTSQRLVRLLGAEVNDEAQVLLVSLLQGVARLDSLIDDVLISSTAGSRVEKTLISLDDVLADVLEVLADELLELDATVLHEDPLGEVLGNRVQLRRLLQNLILNSVRHRSPDRPLVIRVATHRAAGATVLVITDNGVGIGPTDREKVFSLFHRLPRAGDGTGIGLAICRRIVEAHGGRIWFDAAPHHGTVVSFSIPDSDSEDVPDASDRVDHPG